MSKTKEIKWIKPPCEYFKLKWKAFVAIGFKLKNAYESQKFSLFENDEIKKLLITMRSEERQEENSQKERIFVEKEEIGKVEDHLLANCLERFIDEDEGFRAPTNTRELVSFLQNEDNFPFLKGKDIPLSAKVIIAILCASYAETYENMVIDDFPKIFTLSGIPIEEHFSEGKILFDYAKKKDAYLSYSPHIESNKNVVWLSKTGLRELLGVEVKKDLPTMTLARFGRRHPPFFEEALFEKRKHKRKKQDIPEMTLNDIVLEREDKTKLEFVASYLKSSKKNFSKLLFYGPPGTGKTHTAKALSGELKKPLITVDLSKILNPFVGSTEKHLSAIFLKARKESAVLLIDEADSYLKARDGSQRQWELSLVNHLLKLIENEEVNVILCTNFYDALDEAILRRIDEVIEFKMPTKESRKDIWKKELEKNKVPQTLIDFESLSEIELTGGLISNAANKAKKMVLQLGDAITVDTSFIVNLAIDEKKKLGKVFLPAKKCGFGG
jgi:adenylate kinase family enzyme